MYSLLPLPAFFLTIDITVVYLSFAYRFLFVILLIANINFIISTYDFKRIINVTSTAASTELCRIAV
jgi:hypothetical protein